MKHWMQIPAQPGQVSEDGALATEHSPFAVHWPVTSTLWQISNPTSVVHSWPDVIKQLPPEQVP